MTRTVYGIGPWAVKVPWGWGGTHPSALVRGWLANRSEWVSRHRPDVQRPLLSFGYVVNVYPRASSLVRDRYFWEEHVRPWLQLHGYSAEESKYSSWGLFGDRWLLLDYDCAHAVGQRGWVGGWYYGRQERLARRWAR